MNGNWGLPWIWLFPVTRQSITPWVEALGWHRSLNHSWWENNTRVETWWLNLGHLQVKGFRYFVWNGKSLVNLSPDYLKNYGFTPFGLSAFIVIYSTKFFRVGWSNKRIEQWSKIILKNCHPQTVFKKFKEWFISHWIICEMPVIWLRHDLHSIYCKLVFIFNQNMLAPLYENRTENIQ